MSRPLICTTVSARDCRTMAKKARLALSMGSDLVELRADHLAAPASEQFLDALSGVLPRAVVTVRPVSEGGRFAGDEHERLELLRDLAAGRPAFVDVELAALESTPRLEESFRDVPTIVSWHDFERTPRVDRLVAKARAASSHGGMAKIATTANSPGDVERILSLYGSFKPGQLIAFCMGAQGVRSRIESARLGSPLAYCSLPSEPVAPGQLSLHEMKTALEVVAP